MKRTERFLTPSEVADDLQVGRTTVYRWCDEGKIPSIKLGRSIRIPTDAYLAARGNLLQTSDDSASPELLALMDDWLHVLRKGSRPLAKRTVDGYRYHFMRYLRITGGGSSFRDLVNKAVLARALESMPISQFSNRYNLYFAVISFLKYLVDRQLLSSQFLIDLRPLRPKRFYPARKTVVDSDEIERLIAAIWVAKGNTPYERQLNFALVKTFLLAGLRNQELCDLSLSDVDLKKRLLIVRIGKGAKTRQLGINQELDKVLSEYLRIRPLGASSALFVTEKGTPLTTAYVSRRVQRLARCAGVDVTPHGLRRSFVTQSALKGHSLAVISRACGHANLSTTQGYLMITERQVIDSMRDW